MLWEQRYRLTEDGHAVEPSIEASWERIALALANAEAHDRDGWRRRFLDVLAGFRFLPAGRILANAGNARRQTLLNCFACGTLHDSVGGIFGALTEAMVTLQAGGGVGCDFSPLRPHGMPVAGSTAVASGPVSFMGIWDHACAVMGSTREREGAIMAVLRCDHPDIERFIDARRPGNGLGHFCLSVLVTDAFVDAVERGAPWPLVFPAGPDPLPSGTAVCERDLPGAAGTTTCVVQRVVDARALWDRITAAAFETGDPGVLFIDRIERQDNLYYCERIAAANPCGEAPLPPHGACNLGSINLVAFVRDAFGAHPRLDVQALEATAAVAARMLDNVYEITPFPLQAQKHAALASRRLGLGMTGLADALAMLGVDYGSEAARVVASEAMRHVCLAAYRSSVELASERGRFPAFDTERYLQAPFVQRLPDELRKEIRRHGMRNSHLTAIAPAGSISLLANNTSCGIEPIRMLHGERALPGLPSVAVQDYAWALLHERCGEQATVPPALAHASEAGVAAQLDMMAFLQPWVDQAIAKTVRIPAALSLDDCRTLYVDAWRQGLKGCTMYRAAAAAQAADGTGCHR
jgi:ribonucleoside-diphosphate reductase alpha chain